MLKSRGAQVIKHVSATALACTEEGWPHTVHWTRSGVTHKTQFDCLIDCSGREGALKKASVINRFHHSTLRNIALWFYKSDLPLEGFGAEGTIRILSIEDGWVWLIPLQKNVVNVGVVIHQDRLKNNSKEGKQELCFLALRQAASLKGVLDLETEKLTSKLYIETDFSYTSDRFCGPGFPACGDAACFIDPLLSSGVHLAMMSGVTAAASVHSILTNEISETRALNYFEMTYRKCYIRYLILCRRSMI
jgi:flavin-dependent dehydrogenase